MAAVPDFVYTFDLDGRFMYANEALHRLLQRKSGEMVGLNFHDLGYPEPLASTLQSQIQEVVKTAGMVRAETLYESAFGVGYYEYIFVPILSEDGQVAAVAGTTRDITDRKRMEDTLRASQAKAEELMHEQQAERQKLLTLFQQAPAFIALLSGPNFVFEFANDEYYRLIGHRQIIGKSVLEALPEVEGQGFIELLEGVLQTGEPYVGRSMPIMLTREGDAPSLRYVDFIYQAVKESPDEISAVLAHGVDVTDQVLARQEVERLYAEMEDRVRERTLQLENANREMEGFTYSVSHDLRAPLRAIISSSRILLEENGLQLNPEGREQLRRQETAANKLAVLIDELLKLSRLSRQPLHKSPVDFSSMAQAVAEDLAKREGERVCGFEIAPGMMVTADPTSLRLLLANLMENACKFSPNGPTVEIGMTMNGNERIFWVKDHGVGFDMQYAAKVFLPFERLVTDAQFPGTGIGLTNVKRIAERHGGRVWVESVPGEGSTFYFTLA